MEAEYFQKKLRTLIESSTWMEKKTFFNYTIQMAESVRYLHEDHKLIHNNLYDSWRLTKANHFLLTNFINSGFSKETAAPEQNAGEEYSFSADVYTLGLLFGAILEKGKVVENVKKGGKRREELTSKYGVDLKNLVDSMLEVDSEKRPEIGVVLASLKAM